MVHFALALSLLSSSPPESVEALLDVDAIAATHAFPFRRFDVPPPAIWPAALATLWNEGNQECALVSLASSAKWEMNGSARCCAIRLAKALQKRFDAFQAHDPVPALHAEPVSLSTPVKSSPLKPRLEPSPLQLRKTCSSLPRALVLSERSVFASVLQLRWASLGATGSPQRCTLQTLTHLEPPESSTGFGGTSARPEQPTVSSSILRCGAVTVVNESTDDVTQLPSTRAVDDLLVRYAAEACADRGVDAEPVAKEQLVRVPSTEAQFVPAVTCSELPKALKLEGASKINAPIMERWATIGARGPETACTVEEKSRAERFQVDENSPPLDITITTSTLRCGVAEATVEHGDLGKRIATRALDALLDQLALVLCASSPNAVAAPTEVRAQKPVREQERPKAKPLKAR